MYKRTIIVACLPLLVLGCSSPQPRKSPVGRQDGGRSALAAAQAERQRLVVEFVLSLTDAELRTANYEGLSLPPEQRTEAPDRGLPYSQLTEEQQALLGRVWTTEKEIWTLRGYPSDEHEKRFLAAEAEPWGRAVVFNVGYLPDPEGSATKFGLDFSVLRADSMWTFSARFPAFDPQKLPPTLRAAGLDFVARGERAFHPLTPEQKARRDALLTQESQAPPGQ